MIKKCLIVYKDSYEVFSNYDNLKNKYKRSYFIDDICKNDKKIYELSNVDKKTFDKCKYKVVHVVC